MELISIIVPVYNVEKYLDQCIASLLTQTYPYLEIILVDDGSTDSSGKICDAYCEKDNRVKVIHKNNEGLGFARNTGLQYIQGKYVTFIDSDDYANQDLIQNLYDEVTKNNVDTCIGGFKRVDDLGNTLYKEEYNRELLNTKEDIYKMLSKMLGSSPDKSDAIRMSVWNVLYSVEIIKKNNIIFPSEREIISEDIIFNIDYYQFAKKISIINTSSYNYRMNLKSLSQSYKSDRLIKYNQLYNEIINRIYFLPVDLFPKYRVQRQYFVNIKGCIKQENTQISGLTYNKAIKNITNICNNKQLQNIIKDYPIKRLGIKQKVFLILIKHKFANLLYLYARFVS